MPRRICLALAALAFAACATPAVRIGLSPKALDRAVSPCDDFFAYACGGWLRRTEIPADRPAFSRGFMAVMERNLLVLRDHLEGRRSLPSGETPGFSKARDYYAACMNEGAITQKGLAALAPQLELINKFSGGDDFIDAIVAMHKLGVAAPFGMGSQLDLVKPTDVVASVDQAGLGLPDRDYYLISDDRMLKIRARYAKHIERLLVLSGQTEAEASEASRTIIEMETKLATASMSKVDRREPTKLHNRLELAGLTKLAPDFEWAYYFKAMGVAEGTGINVVSPPFFARFSKMLKTIPANTLRSYLRFHLIRAMAPSLPGPFEKEAFEMSQLFSGAKKQLPRWKRCIMATDRGVGELLAQPFVAERFGAEGKQGSEEMVRAITAAFGKRLEALPWMDEATRVEARTKLARIANLIGFPNKWREYPFAVSRDAHLANSIAARNERVRFDLSKIGKPVDKGEWKMTPHTVNAYYQPQLNQMVFPAGILQPPYFHSAAPLPVNYGAIGMVIGHELSHGFDDKGRKFDAQGNMRDWWTAASGTGFESRAQCVVKQFEGYEPLPGVKLNGKLMLGENIADLGGLEIAYDAVQSMKSKLPAKDEHGFTPEQQFFLGFAQSWCFKARPEYVRVLAKVDPHAPARFRVNGPLTNMPAFQRAFSCPANARMVAPSASRCAVW